MVLVDTNILAYLLIEDERTAGARALLDLDPDWHSDSFVIVELLNVLVTNMRVRRMSLRHAMIVLEQAQSVMTGGLHAAGHADTLALVARFKVSAYDARFLALAGDLGVRLVTEDIKLRNAAPRLTQSLADALVAD
jgi:predicted nucleic acid-binding protein